MTSSLKIRQLHTNLVFNYRLFFGKFPHTCFEYVFGMKQVGVEISSEGECSSSTYRVTIRRSSSCSNYAPSFDLYVVIKLAFRTESIEGHIVMKSVTPSPEWGRELRSHWASIHVLGARNLLYMFVSCNTDHPGHGRRLSSVTQHHLSENASVDNDEDDEEIWLAERYFESS